MKSSSLLGVLTMLLLVMLALFSPSCGGTAEPEVFQECLCPLDDDLVMNCGDGSQVTLYAGTDIDPCNCMSAASVSDLPDPECLPHDGNVIAAISITPDGAQFSPDGLLHFALPDPALYEVGTWLYIWEHTSGTCDPDSNLNNWVAQPNHAVVIAGGFADGPIRHTSIYALVDMQGQVGSTGKLITPFTQQDGEILFDVEVLASSTHRDLQGKVITVMVNGIEGDPTGFVATLNKMPVDSVFAFQWDKSNLFTVWWEDIIVHFYVKDVLLP